MLAGLHTKPKATVTFTVPTTVPPWPSLTVKVKLSDPT